MEHHVYMLRLQNGMIYVGCTNNLARRHTEHRAGRGSLACAKSHPAELIYTESFPDLVSAMRREKQLKRWSRAKKLALAEGKLDRLHQLAKRVLG